MVWGALFTAAMGTGVSFAQRVEPGLSTLAASSVRVWMNLILVGVLVNSLNEPWRKLWPKSRKWLWVWGVAGAATVSSYFFAVGRLGMGEATFLQSSYAVFASLLAHFFLRQRLQRGTIVALVGSVIGLALLFSPTWSYDQAGGAGMAIASGFAAAVAYLAVAKTGTSHSPVTVLFFWTLLCLPLHTMGLLFFKMPLPRSGLAWSWLIAAGACGALAQYFIALAYQRGPVASVSAVSYLAPLFCLIGDWVFFDYQFAPRTCLGGACILFFGVLLPIKKSRSGPLPLAAFTAGPRSGNDHLGRIQNFVKLLF
jgi:drug/metabolite transporter (DMT)-like permease